MNIRKLSILEWVAVVRGLASHIGPIIRIAGTQVVALIRAFLEIAGSVEEMFPVELDAEGKPIKRSTEKRDAFVQLVIASFATAEDKVADVAEVIGRVADTLVPMLNAFGIFKTARV